MSRLVTKPTMWLCAQRRLRSAWHPPSLISVFAVRMKKAWVLNYQLSAQRRLWSDWADAQAGRTATLLVLSRGGSYKGQSNKTRILLQHHNWRIPFRSPLSAIPFRSPLTAIPFRSLLTAIPFRSPLTAIPFRSPLTAIPFRSPLTAIPFRLL